MDQEQKPVVQEEMESRIFRHEGTHLLATEEGQATPVIAALVIAAVAGEAPGELGLRWRLHGDPIQAVPTLARFLFLNPAFSMAVQGVMGMMASGRLDGGRGCSHTQEEGQ
jgi:hypothetical protein